ncbi:lasso peptide biosynthesis B2 protein [Sphingomonas sp.]|uniref:lasso peptide biosynthesis B2 protein n=1 Tax=Sphingomonas sp. TaxID=28214 RepID=UPI001DB44332|nr:lasso peptide biosynthesis B2 protein [Sphingomonas sp.]MBX9797090.1 lasso peptide biosynthesis B2 protein [Sphingomonas sp.]
MRQSPVLRRARTLASLGPARLALLAEAALALAWARLTILLTPSMAPASRWGVLVPADDPGAGSGLIASDAHRLATARQIGWAVATAARLVPFRAVCLPQALAARAMLARRGTPSVLHFGARRDDARAMVAHAWLDAAGARVTGYPIDPGIAEIGAFVNHQ